MSFIVSYIIKEIINPEIICIVKTAMGTKSKKVPTVNTKPTTINPNKNEGNISFVCRMFGLQNFILLPDFGLGSELCVCLWAQIIVEILMYKV